MKIASHSTFISLPLQLNAGDNFYFYSDEIIELTNANGEKYGRERLLNVISSSANNNAQDVIRSIRQDATDFSGGSRLKADVAIAVLKYTPVAVEE